MSGALRARVAVTRGAFSLDISLDVAAGHTVALMGPSGAGKSTILGALAGRIPLREGFVRVEGAHDDRPRGIVLLGQDPRLFPHLSARDNVAFGLRARGVRHRDAAAAAEQWLERVGLAGFGDRRPARLSGGQQQRVAIARALATTPDALLLDEPLTALDVETATEVRAVLRDELAATGTTAIVATHDAVDAVALARDLVVLEDGAITQRGPMRTVLAEPATRFVAAVAGLNRVPGRIRDGRFEAEGIVLGLADDAETVDGAAVAVFRPAAVRAERSRTADPRPTNSTDGAVGGGALRGGTTNDTGRDTTTDPASPVPGRWHTRVERFEVTPGGIRMRAADPDVAADLSADVAADLDLAPGVPVELSVSPRDIRILRSGGIISEL